MIEKDKISIIVPVYNVEKFLIQCVESITNQTYKNIEIILVDDGSTDNSGKICDELATKDERIKVIHKENAGVSCARNVGMDAATGEYLMFPDSDDFLFENSCEVLVNKIKSEKADFVIGNYSNCNEDGTLWEKPVFNKEKYKEFRLSIKDCRDSFFVMNSAAWNKIFNHEFILKIGARFAEGYTIAEDAMFTTYCFIKSKKVFYLPDIIYAYRRRAATTSASVNCTSGYFYAINKSYLRIYENFRDNDEIEFYRCFYAKSMTYMLYKFIDSTLLSYDERLDVLMEMRWFYKLSVDLEVPACQESLSVIINKIISGDYKDVIDICSVVADIRKTLPKDIKENMSKPDSEMYEKILR